MWVNNGNHGWTVVDMAELGEHFAIGEQWVLPRDVASVLNGKTGNS